MMDHSHMTRIAETDVDTLSEAVDRVVAGEALLVTRDGVAVAEMHPVDATRPRRRRFVPTSEAKRMFAGLPPVDYAAMRAEADALLGEDRIW